MSRAGLSKIIAVLSVIIVIVGIGAFLGGMYLGGLATPGSGGMQTITISSLVTITRTVTQNVMQTMVQTSTQPAVSLPSKIVIGLAVPLSGSLVDTGKRGFWGVMAAVRWVNEVYGGVHLYGKAIPLEVKYYDDESKKENVIALTERLITLDKVNFLLSTHSSPLVFAQAPIPEKYRVLYINWGGATDAVHEQGYRYAVQILTPASMYLSTALDALKSADPSVKRIAILYRDDELNRIAGMNASAKARAMGFEVVYEKVYPANINDFSPYIADLARVNADALLVGAYPVDGRLLTRQLSDAGVNFKFIAMNQAPCLPDYYDSFKTLAEGILCPSQWEPGVKYSPELAKRLGIEWFGPTVEEFMRFFANISGDPGLVSYHAAMAAAGVLVLVKAIETAQSLDPTAVREALNKLYLMTFFGLFRIDPITGKQVAHEMVLGQWQSGRFVVVWPPSAAEKKLYYPIPTWDEKRAGRTASS